MGNRRLSSGTEAQRANIRVSRSGLHWPDIDEDLSFACGAMSGAVFESFVVSEILKSFSNAGLEYRDFVSYYRGRDKLKVRQNGKSSEAECEIDLVIEENGVLYPIEVKKSSTPKANDAEAFVVLDKIKGKKRGMGAVVCNCAAPLHLRDNLLALPAWYL